MTLLEGFLLVLLLAAVAYIIYLEQQPKTDREREQHALMKKRLHRTIDEQARRKQAQRRSDD